MSLLLCILFCFLNWVTTKESPQKLMIADRPSSDLIDFNGMSTHLGSFYDWRLWNHVYSTFIFCVVIS